jgi:predicted transcriptional regulator
MENNKQHIQLPNNMIVNDGLKPKDLLVYAMLKKYMNNETKECFPSLQTLSEITGYSINAIRGSLSSLNDKKYILIRKEGKKNIYIFSPYKNFEPFSYIFLESKIITVNEKAYILASQQFFIKDRIGIGKTTYSNEELAKRLNISARTISRLDKLLIQKGFLDIIKTKVKDPITGLYIYEKIFYLGEMGQSVIWDLEKHKENIIEDSKDIKMILRKSNEVELENKKIISENQLYKRLILKYVPEDELKKEMLNDSINEIIL